MRLASSWMVMVSGMVTSRTSFSLGAAAEGGDGSVALLVGAGRGHDREPSAVFLSAAARRFRRRRRSRRTGTAARTRGLVVVGLERRSRARPCRRNAVLAEAFLRLL